MGHHVLEVDEQCPVCKGTGIYVGMAEHNGAGVQCVKCKGTGCHRLKVEYEDFVGRVPRDDVVWVIECNPGIVVGCRPDTDDKLAAFGGMTYEEWSGGLAFSPGMEMRGYTCPAWWYQCAGARRKPDWKECGFGQFSNCQHFSEKHGCWARWDRENA